LMFPSTAAGLLHPPLLTSEEILHIMEARGVYLIAIFFILLATGYGLMFLRRGIRYLKMVESKYIDESILDTVELSLRTVWGLSVLFSCLALLGLAWDWFWDNVWMLLADNPATGTGYIVPFMSCVIVGVLVGISIRLLHHNILYKEGRLGHKPRSVWNPRVALVVELFTKYLIIAMGVVMVITISLTAIGFYDQIVGGTAAWIALNRNGLIFLAIVLVLGYFFIKVSEAFLDDMRKKETSFSPQILTVSKLAIRYLITIVVGIVVLFSVLRMFELAETGVVIVVVFIVLIGVIGAVAAASNLRNAFSGLILMGFRPFVEGDTVRLLDNVVCDIVQVGLIFTKVRTVRGELIDIPNNDVLSRPIYNYSRSSDYAIAILVGVPEGSDIERVREWMADAIVETEHVVDGRPPEIFTVGMEQDRVVLEAQVHTGHHKRIRHIKSELMKNISAALRRHGVCCTVHLSDRDESEAMRIVKGHETQVAPRRLP